VSQKSNPKKLLGIFSFRLRIFPRNFSNLLSVYIHTYLPILVDLS